jgi:spore coat protein CotH
MNYMRVAINGESWGVYLNAQQFNRDFLRDFYKTTAGARWKVPGGPGGRGGMEYLGADIEPYRRIYEIKSKDDPKSWKAMIEMFRLLNETSADKLEAALAPVLDVDGALRFLALDVALVNSDGFWTRASDYSIYQDEKGRFHVLPHDMNEALAAEGGRGRGPGPGFGPPPDGFPPPDQRRGGPPDGGGFFGGRGRGGPMMMGGGPDLDPLVGLNDASKPLRSKLLAVPALRAKYLAYVKEIADQWLDWKRIGPMVQQYQALIADDVKADTRKLYSFEAFQADLADSPNSVKHFAEERRAYLQKYSATVGQ